MTPHRRIFGVDYIGRLLHIGECCWWRPAYANRRPKLDNRQEDGIWLGRTEKSDEILIGTEYGVKECRTVKRKPEDEQWNLEAVKKMKGFPWKMTPEETEVVSAGLPIHMPKAAPGLPRSGIPAAEPGTPRRQYLMKATIVKKYGATKGCPGCTTVGRAHTEACSMASQQISARR